MKYLACAFLLALLPSVLVATSTLDSLPPAKTTISSRQDYSRLAPPTQWTDRREDRRAVRRATTRWDVHFGVGAYADRYNYYGNAGRFTRATGEFFTNRFVGDNGEVIPAEVTESWVDEGMFLSTQYRLGIARQSTWGGRFNLTAGYARARYRNNFDPLDGLNTNELRTYTDATERSLYLDLGFQYTFNRRGRFRPYLGAGLTTFLFYDGQNTLRFADANTQSTGLVEHLGTTQYLPLYPDFHVMAGFQYGVTERLSVGAGLWANLGSEVTIMAPFQVEARYQLFGGK